MLFTKMNQIIDEISAEVAEREDLIECIAIALLSRKISSSSARRDRRKATPSTYSAAASPARSSSSG